MPHMPLVCQDLGQAGVCTYLAKGTECSHEAREVLQCTPVLLLCCIQAALLLAQLPKLQVDAGQEVQWLI